MTFVDSRHFSADSRLSAVDSRILLSTLDFSLLLSTLDFYSRLSTFTLDLYSRLSTFGYTQGYNSLLFLLIAQYLQMSLNIKI
jgi:hypothetical protein